MVILLVEWKFWKAGYMNKRMTVAAKIITTGVAAAALGAGTGGAAYAADTGPISIVNFTSGKCISIQDPMNAFSPVVLQTCNGQSSQKWHLHTNGNILTVVSQSTGNCLRASEPNGSGVFTSPDCQNPPKNLQWAIVPFDPSDTSRIDQIVHVDDRCIDAPNANEGVQLLVTDCVRNNNQLDAGQVWSLRA
jgi:hypothetical protein